MPVDGNPRVWEVPRAPGTERPRHPIPPARERFRMAFRTDHSQRTAGGGSRLSQGGGMQNTPFQAFIGKVRASRRLLYGDLQRLQRDVLPKGIQDRHQAEALIALEGVLERFDDGWPGFLAGALKAFVLSMSSRPGIVDRETADWLASVLEHLSRKVAAGIAREIILEAGQVDGALLTRVERPSQGRGRGRARAPSGQ